MARSSGIIRVIKALRKGRKTKGSFAGKLAGVGGKGAWLGMKLGYINSLIDRKIDEFADNQQPEYSMADLGFAPKQSSSTEVSTISIADIVDSVSVVPTDIIPELGSEEGQYARHLNLIIERVARLESSVLTQAELIAKLENAIGNYNDNERKERLNTRRQEKEDDIEKRTWARDAGRAVLDKGQEVGSIVGRMVKPFLLPIAALTLASAASAMGDEQSEEPLLSDDNLDAIANTFDFLETTGVSIAVAAGRAVPAAMAVGSSAAAGVQRAAGALKFGKAGDIAADFVGPRVQAAANPIMNFATKFTSNVKANKIIQSITRAGTIFDGLAKHAGKIVESVRAFVSSLPAAVGNILRKAGKGLVKWFLVFEAFKLAWRGAQTYAIGGITEEQFHAQNKEHLNEIIRLMGPPWILTLLGSIAFPGVGTVIGFVAGIIWGEKIYDVIGFDNVVNWLYDFIFLSEDRIADAKEMINKVNYFFRRELPKMIGDAVSEFGRNVADTVFDFAADTAQGAKDFYNKSDAPLLVGLVSDGVERVHGVIETVSPSNVTGAVAAFFDNYIKPEQEITTDDVNDVLAEHMPAVETITDADTAIIETIVNIHKSFKENKVNRKLATIAIKGISESITDIEIKKRAVTILNEIYATSTPESKVNIRNRGRSIDSSSLDAQQPNIMLNDSISTVDQTKSPSKPSVEVKLTDIVPVTGEKKDVVVVPLMMQQNRPSNDRASYNAGNSQASGVEGASPTYSTHDRYLDINYTS